MHKRFLLRCQIRSWYNGWWHDEEFYFDEKDDMISFIKKGNGNIRPKDIRIEAAFELKEIDIEL